MGSHFVASARGAEKPSAGIALYLAAVLWHQELHGIHASSRVVPNSRIPLGWADGRVRAEGSDHLL